MAFGGLSFFGDLIETIHRLHRQGRITDQQLVACHNTQVPDEVAEAARYPRQRRPYLALKLKGFPVAVRQELMTRYCPRTSRSTKDV